MKIKGFLKWKRGIVLLRVKPADDKTASHKLVSSQNELHLLECNFPHLTFFLFFLIRVQLFA